MKRILQLAAGAMFIASPAFAQKAAADNGGSFFKSPVFVFQPGVAVSPALSGVGPNDNTKTTYPLNLRFVTVLPTRYTAFSLVTGVGFTPNGRVAGAGNIQFNQPVFFYGAIIPFPYLSQATNNWVSLSINPLGAYGLGLGGTDRALYGHDLVIEGAALVNVGEKMMHGMGPWSKISVYALLDQVVTHPTKYMDNGSEKTDRFNPTALIGLSIPIAPWGEK